VDTLQQSNSIFYNSLNRNRDYSKEHETNTIRNTRNDVRSSYDEPPSKFINLLSGFRYNEGFSGGNESINSNNIHNMKGNENTRMEEPYERYNPNFISTQKNDNNGDDREYSSYTYSKSNNSMNSNNLMSSGTMSKFNPASPTYDNIKSLASLTLSESNR
jgi:hypothetical protein